MARTLAQTVALRESELDQHWAALEDILRESDLKCVLELFDHLKGATPENALERLAQLHPAAASNVCAFALVAMVEATVRRSRRRLERVE